MKRFCLISSVVATSFLVLAPAANATEPAIVYVPTEATELYPSGGVDTPCAGISTNDYNSGLGCIPGLEEATTEPAYGDAAGITTALETAFAPFDVHVTNVRPPAYIPHYMLHVSDEVSMMGMSYSCTGAPHSCSSLARNAVAFTSGGTDNCMMPDTVQTAIYAVGRLAGLEGSTNALDPMHFPPDFLMPATEFQDACDALSPQISTKTMMPLPLECTSADHTCAGMNTQNTVEDLTEYFGARTEDADPPVLTNSVPADMDDYQTEGEDTVLVQFSVDIEDADVIVGLSWVVESDVFEEIGGSVSVCTGNHCDTDLLDGQPFRPTDGEWGFEIGLPGGTYNVTLESADFHGNVADPIMYSFTVDGGMPSTTTGETDSATATDATATMTASGTMTGVTTFLDTGMETGTGEEDDSDTSDEMMDDTEGCACTSSPGAGGAMMLIFGVLGFIVTRRRD